MARRKEVDSQKTCNLKASFIIEAMAKSSKYFSAMNLDYGGETAKSLPLPTRDSERETKAMSNSHDMT